MTSAKKMTKKSTATVLRKMPTVKATSQVSGWSANKHLFYILYIHTLVCEKVAVTPTWSSNHSRCSLCVERAGVGEQNENEGRWGAAVLCLEPVNVSVKTAWTTFRPPIRLNTRLSWITARPQRRRLNRDKIPGTLWWKDVFFSLAPFSPTLFIYLFISKGWQAREHLVSEAALTRSH